MYLDSWVEHKCTVNKQYDMYAKKSEKVRVTVTGLK